MFFTLGLYILYSQADYYTNPDYEEQQQKEKKERRRNRLLFGGNFWMSFGTSSYVEIAPIIGYKVTPKLTAGAGPVYIYENYRDFYQRSTYGIKTMVTYSLFSNLSESLNVNIGNIILHAENECLNIEPYFIDQYGNIFSEGRVWIDNLLLGGGIMQPIGRGGISLMILWDVTQHPYSYYTNPILRLGFYF